MKYLVLNIFLLLPFLLSATPQNYTEQPNQEKKATEKSETDKKEDEKKEKEEKVIEPQKLLKVGNLAFPASQQPEPLISFGQNFLDQKQAQFLFLTTELKAKSEYAVTVVPSFLYGLRGDLSIFISVPEAVRFRQKRHHSSGIGDIQVQLEYAPYTKEFYTYYDQISIVTNVTIPTGSARKKTSHRTWSE